MSILNRYKDIIDNWSAFADACRTPLPTCIWRHPGRTQPGELEARLRRDGTNLEQIQWYPGACKLAPEFATGRRAEYWAGLYHVQEEVAMLPAHLLRPEPGERVLELCAAPGNKTAQMALMMQNTGMVVANEVNRKRMQPLRQVINRLGLANVTTTISDGTAFPKQPWQFDRVMADVVCSCEGTSRKNPELLELDENTYSLKVTRTQTALLIRALQLCKPGGRIAYATCTYAPEENEAVVEAALAAVAPKIRARILPCSVPGFTWSPGLTSWQDTRFREEMENTLRVYPHQNDTGGFFVALLEKTEDARKDFSRTSAPWRPDFETRVRKVDVEPLRQLIQDRFGIEQAALEPFEIFRTNSKVASLLRKEHDLPRHPRLETVGLPLIHINMKHKKPTTSAAQLLGPAAGKHILQATQEQAEAYLSGATCAASPDQISNFETEGYVFVKYDGMFLGVGIFYSRGEAGELISQFPKAWRIEL